MSLITKELASLQNLRSARHSGGWVRWFLYGSGKHGTGSSAFWALFVLFATAFAGTGLADGRPAIRDVVYKHHGSSTHIQIIGAEKATFNAYRLSTPSRIVVEIDNSRLQRLTREAVVTPVNGWAVSSVSASTLQSRKASTSMVRVVVLLARPSNYRIKTDSRGIVVMVRPKRLPTKKAVEHNNKLGQVKTRMLLLESEITRAHKALEIAQNGLSQVEEKEAHARNTAERAGRQLSKAKELRIRDRSLHEKAVQKTAYEQKVMDQAVRDAHKETRSAQQVLAKALDKKSILEKDIQKLSRKLRSEREMSHQEKLQLKTEVTEVQAKLEKKNRLHKKMEIELAKAKDELRDSERSYKKMQQQLRRVTLSLKQQEQDQMQQREVLQNTTRTLRKEVAARQREKEQLATIGRSLEHVKAGRLADHKKIRQLQEMLEKAEQSQRRVDALEKQWRRASLASSDMVRLQRDLQRAKSKKTSEPKSRSDQRKSEKLAARIHTLEKDLAKAQRLAKRVTVLEKALLQAQNSATRISELEKAVAEAQRATHKQTVEKRQIKKRPSKKQSSISVAQIERIDFVNRRSVSSIRIKASRRLAPKVVLAKPGTLVLEIPRAALPKRLHKRLDVQKYNGPVQDFRAIASRDGQSVRIVATVDSSSVGHVNRVGNTYYWDFAKKKSTVVKPSAKFGSFGSQTSPITSRTVAQYTDGKRKIYRGRKYDFDFKDADIHDLLRTLSEVGGVNMVIPDNVRANVTVRLRRVPWDQAMEVILASKGFWYKREGKIIRIAPRKELDAETEANAARRRALLAAEVPLPEIFTLNYSKAQTMQAQLGSLLSTKGNIEVDVRTNSLIINDITANRQKVIEMARRLDTATPQVQIEARIVEARSTYRRQVGIQWGGTASMTQATGNATGLTFPSDVVIGGGANDSGTTTNGVSGPTNFAVNLPAPVGTGVGGGVGFSLGSLGGNYNLQLRLSALEEQGTIKLISAPKISAENNVQASISQGVSIPISVITAEGAQTTFVDAQLGLTVKPRVSQRDCTISMDVKISKNEPDFQNTGARGDPSIIKKEAETTVLVADGETTVIGGIYTRNAGSSYSKVPFLADIPIIGWLFKTKSETDDRTEVLVFITPKITNKADLRCSVK